MTVATLMKSLRCRLAVGAAASDHLEDLGFTMAERFLGRGPGLVKQPGSHRGREHRLAACGGAHRAEQLRPRYVLEQVAGGASLEIRDLISAGQSAGVR